MTRMEHIRDFLARKRLAVVGVSQQPNDFSRIVLREFRKRGYQVAAVNPHATEVDGEPCHARVQDVIPPVDWVLLMTSPAVTDTVVRDCSAAGVSRVWMFRAGGKGSVSGDAVRFCEERGIAVVAGECPMMFLPGAAWFHGLHGWIRKISRTYPR